jgi:uncharacterized protein (DUF736 family)
MAPWVKILLWVLGGIGVGILGTLATRWFINRRNQVAKSHITPHKRVNAEAKPQEKVQAQSPAVRAVWEETKCSPAPVQIN